MPEQHQVIAIEKVLKKEAHDSITAIDRALSNATGFFGEVTKYQQSDENSAPQPDRKIPVRFRAKDLLAELREKQIPYLDLVLTKDTGNGVCAADVVVDGVTIAEKVPVPTLIFLEKQLKDLGTLLSRAVTLPPEEDWDQDPNSGLYKTEEVWKNRTEKREESLVLYPATDKFPAQTQLVSRDVVVGKWLTRKVSGALGHKEKTLLVDRIGRLTKAVSKARAEANSMQVENKKMGESLYSYLYNGLGIS